MMPGQRLARGVCRHLNSHGFATLTEFVPASGLRVDVLALGPAGEIWIVECKSSRVDFVSDTKWQGYIEWCDQYFWAVDAAFPSELLPSDTGLIIADDFDAEIVRYGSEVKLASARRKAMILRIARTGLHRVQNLTDPRPAARVRGDLQSQGRTDEKPEIM